jgi:hypothetical protein
MDTANQQIELSLTNHFRPIPSYPADSRQTRSWQQHYLLEQLDQIWFLPVWYWPDFWSTSAETPEFPDGEEWRREALPSAGPVSFGQRETGINPSGPGSTLGQWLSVQISAPGALPLVELQGPGQVALPNGDTKNLHPVTTNIIIAEGALRLDGASLRLPAGLPAALAISHQPAASGKNRWRVNLALHHPEHGPFFEFQGVFCLPQRKKSGLVDQLQTGVPIRQVLELL